MSMMQLSKAQLQAQAAGGDSAAAAELQRREAQRASGGRGSVKVGGKLKPMYGVGFAVSAERGYSQKQLGQLAEVGYSDAAGALARKKSGIKAPKARKAKAKAPKAPRMPKVQTPGRAAQAVKMKLIWEKATEIAQREYQCELRHVLSDCLRKAHAWYKSSRGAQAEVKMAANPNMLFYHNRYV